MISERQLSKGYASFWRDVAPMIDSFWRAQNLQATRLWEPIDTQAERFSRAFTNELAFESFAEWARKGNFKDVSHLKEYAKTSAPKVRKYLARFTARNAEEAGPSATELSEATRLASRLCSFLQSQALHQPLIVRPHFSGCGDLMAAEGDLINGTTLYEVKAGHRLFKASDLKQALIYCALNRLRPIASISGIALLNPRVGICWSYDLDACCHAISGKSSPELLDDITSFVSQPEGSR